MKGHILKYVLLLSLLLNLSFLGAAGFTYYRQTQRSIIHNVRERLPFGAATQAHIFEPLSLKPEQLKFFQEKAGSFHEALNGKHRRVAELRLSLLDLMRKENPDRTSIEAAISEMNGAQREMQELIIAHMLELKSMLDKEQQKTFADLIQKAMTEQSGMQCP